MTTLWKTRNFLTLSTSSFYRLKKSFFDVEYRQTHFPGLCCQKKNAEKMVNF